MNKKSVLSFNFFLMRLFHQIKCDHLSMISAAMAYYALFSFVPAISTIVLIYTFVSDPKNIANHISLFSQFIPLEIQKILTELFDNLTKRPHSTIGISTITAFLLTLWAASRGNRSIIDGLTIIFKQSERSGRLHHYILSLAMTLLGALLGLVTIGVVVIIPLFTHFINLGRMTEILSTILSWTLLLTFFSFFLTFTYRFGANDKKMRCKWINFGSALASIIWIIASALLSWYAKEFRNYNKTYGSLGAIIILMLWFYLTSYVILLGAEINMVIEQIKADKKNQSLLKVSSFLE